VIFSEALRNEPEGVFGFATGSTPEGLYAALIRMHKEEGLDFSRMTAFNLDEYYPIKRSDEQSYFHFMRDRLFDHVNIEFGRINVPDGETNDPTAECADYDKKIEDSGGIGLQILGIGANGHIGFNEPSDSFSSQTLCVPLSEVTVRSNARFFESQDQVPRHALTMGVRNIMMCKKIILLCNGAAKAAILRDALKGPITPLVPASALQLHRDVTVIADQAAVSLL
jgi:glucosamine-6-phosphate deaminase